MGLDTRLTHKVEVDWLAVFDNSYAYSLVEAIDLARKFVKAYGAVAAVVYEITGVASSEVFTFNPEPVYRVGNSTFSHPGVVHNELI